MWCWLLGCVAALGLTSGEQFQGSTYWWKSRVVYQMYPRSFQDSNGDGNGDIKGVLNRVDYLKQIGVDTVWLSPIYESPWQDNGYDVSNFTRVEPRFGTMDDLMSLTKAVHHRGIKILLDFVPNHSSNKHPWFQQSVKRLDDKTDFYIWRDPAGFQNGNPLPPNNWLNILDSGPAWTYVRERKQFYFHNFGAFQPDFNLSNPAVLHEIKDAMRFWLDRGIDGYRMDAVPWLIEDSLFRNATWIPGCTNRTYAYCQRQDRRENTDQTYALLKMMNDVFEREYKGTKVLFLEGYATPEQTERYYQSISIPFNFVLITEVFQDTNAIQLRQIIDSYLKNVARGRPPTWVIGNHDRPRVGSRLGEEMIDAANMLNLLLPGSSIIYEGEEIGMTDTYIPPGQEVDIIGRDPARTPMQWDTSVNAGFTTSRRPWLPSNANYWKINVKSEMKYENSHLSIFRKLTQVKNMLRGTEHFEMFNLGEWVFGFRRGDSILVLINLNTIEETIVLGKTFSGLPQSVRVVVPSINSGYKASDRINTNSSIFLRPRSAIVLST